MPEGLFSGGGHEARKAAEMFLSARELGSPDVNLFIQQCLLYAPTICDQIILINKMLSRN